MLHYSTEKPTTQDWCTLLQLLFSWELSGKGIWNHTIMNVDPHIINHLKANEWWHSKYMPYLWFRLSCLIWASFKGVKGHKSVSSSGLFSNRVQFSYQRSEFQIKGGKRAAMNNECSVFDSTVKHYYIIPTKLLQKTKKLMVWL